MTNLVLSLSFLLVTNVHSWNDGNEHVSQEWYYDRLKAVEHPTRGYDLFEVKSNVAASVVFDGRTNEVLLSSLPVGWWRVEWETAESRVRTTNGWNADKDFSVATLVDKPTVVHLPNASSLTNIWVTNTALMVTNSCWVTNLWMTAKTLKDSP